VPEISRFFGIVVWMVYRDHNPPHFHAAYGEQEVSVTILDGGIDGHMSKRACVWYKSGENFIRTN
jgi:hypothetical protein